MSRFLNSAQVHGKAFVVLMRMAQGDCLIEYVQRKFLHTSEPNQRTTLEVHSSTICSLMLKGLIFPTTFDFENGRRHYDITDEGRSVVRLMRYRSRESDGTDYYCGRQVNPR